MRSWAEICFRGWGKSKLGKRRGFMTACISNEVSVMFMKTQIFSQIQRPLQRSARLPRGAQGLRVQLSPARSTQGGDGDGEILVQVSSIRAHCNSSLSRKFYFYVMPLKCNPMSERWYLNWSSTFYSKIIRNQGCDFLLSLWYSPNCTLCPDPSARNSALRRSICLRIWARRRKRVEPKQTGRRRKGIAASISDLICDWREYSYE